MFDPKRYSPGDLLTAAERNARNEELRRLGKVRGGANVIVRQGGGGTSIARAGLRERTTIQLTSSANGDGGYSWAEVVRDGAMGWATTGRVGDELVDPAYELNEDVDLTSGDAVYLAERAETTDEWLFWERVSGGNCTTGTVGISAVTCTVAPLIGATATITGPGGFSSSGLTTSPFGFYDVSLAGYPPGTYSYSVAKTGHTTVTGSFAVICGATNRHTVSMLRADGICCGACEDIPSSLTISATVTTGLVTATLTYAANKPGSWPAGVVDQHNSWYGDAAYTETTGGGVDFAFHAYWQLKCGGFVGGDNFGLKIYYDVDGSGPGSALFDGYRLSDSPNACSPFALHTVHTHTIGTTWSIDA